jgi:hypothetical protein
VVVDVPVGGLPALEELWRPGLLLEPSLPPLPILPFRLVFPVRTSRKLSGELLIRVGGREGLLRLAWVLWAGSDGPALGVVSESSDSSPDGGTEEDCDSEGAECDTGEQGNGMASYVATLLSRAPGVQPRCSRIDAG